MAHAELADDESVAFVCQQILVIDAGQVAVGIYSSVLGDHSRRVVVVNPNIQDLVSAGTSRLDEIPVHVLEVTRSDAVANIAVLENSDASIVRNQVLNVVSASI